MLRKFFASPNFLGLLRFWDESRAANGVPDWNGELSAIPADLLPRLIIVQRRDALTYHYVGAENVAQFGRDPTGRSISETLSREYADYISDIIESTLQNRKHLADSGTDLLVKHSASRDQGEIDRAARCAVYVPRFRATLRDHERPPRRRR